jgi:hypothetical protein
MLEGTVHLFCFLKWIVQNCKVAIESNQWIVGENLLILECIGIKQDTFKWSLKWTEYFIKYFQMLKFSDLDKWYFVNYLLDCLFMWKVIALTSSNFAILNNSFKKTKQTCFIPIHSSIKRFSPTIHWLLSIIVLNFPSLSNND